MTTIEVLALGHEAAAHPDRMIGSLRNARRPIGPIDPFPGIKRHARLPHTRHRQRTLHIQRIIDMGAPLTGDDGRVAPGRDGS